MIITKSWESGEGPGDWKKGNIVPILKKSRMEDTGNHQTVSLISVPGTFMKQILLEGLLWHMEDRDMIWDGQHSLTKDKSCLTNLVGFHDGVIVSLDKGRATDVICLEFCKAFDNPLQHPSL